MPEHAKAVRASGQRRLRLINESGNSNAEVASSTPSAGPADDQPARGGIKRRPT